MARFVSSNFLVSSFSCFNAASTPAQLTDLGAQPVEIGMPAEMVTRKIRSDGNDIANR
jgi:uncharacterized OB-fold protein